MWVGVVLVLVLGVGVLGVGVLGVGVGGNCEDAHIGVSSRMTYVYGIYSIV